MVWLTVRAVRVAVESQDWAINESGIKDVTALAALIDPAWIEKPELQGHLNKILQDYCSATKQLGILNAVVYRGELALATGKVRQETFKISQDQTDIQFPLAGKLGVKIQELSYEGRATQGFRPVRRFSKDIQGSNFRGRVEVLISAERISTARDATRNRMIKITVAAAGLVAVLSFLLASFLTYPIRTLARDLRQVSLGNLDHQSRVSSGDEIGDLARAFNQMTSNLQKAQEAEVAQKAMEHELNLATRIQKRLLPAEIPQVPGFEIGAYYHAAREVGGDYYDFLRIDKDHLGLVVADVSGKGVPGSLVMTMTRSLLRMAAAGESSPSETICQVNSILAPDVNPGMFVTLLYLVLHIPTRRIRMVRSGHNAPLLYVSRLKKILHLQPKGIALGLDAQGHLFNSELEVKQFVLNPGDVLVAYTDGIVEEKNPRGEDYSEDRFARLIQQEIRETPQSLIEAVLADLQSHRMGAEQSDDITMLVLKSTNHSSR